MPYRGRLSVYLSVCLSQVGILSKRRKISCLFWHRYQTYLLTDATLGLFYIAFGGNSGISEKEGYFRSENLSQISPRNAVAVASVVNLIRPTTVTRITYTCVCVQHDRRDATRRAASSATVERLTLVLLSISSLKKRSRRTKGPFTRRAHTSV